MEGSHIFGIDEGPSGQEKKNYNQLDTASGFAIGSGEGDITASQTFLRDILSGDPTKIATALAPEISAGQQQASQAKKTAAEFGTRSGGTASTLANIDAAQRGNIINLAGGLQSSAASNLGSLGSSLLSTGIGAKETAFNEAQTMQAQRAQFWNDLFKSVAATAGGIVGALPGSPGGLQDVASNAIGAVA